ncbi:WASH complex subunit 3-like [Argonauta hians]
MDSDGLPLVGTGIDYTKCEAIYQKRTLAFLNHFITHTVRFLNKFSGVCEEKLETMSYRIQRLEITMNILEAKLSSIPGLENVVAPASETATPSTPVPSSETAPAQATPQAAAPSAAPPTPAASAEAAPPPPPTSEEPQKTVSQDPRYMKYFKMVAVGVPEPAVKIKMKNEGLDPSLLDNPNAPAPSGASGPSSNASSDSDDFSD